MNVPRDWIEEEADRRLALERAAGVVTDPAFTALAARTIKAAAARTASAKASPDGAFPSRSTGEVLGAAGSTRKEGVRGSAPTSAARAGQPSGSHAPARSKTTKQKAADADTSTASQTAAVG